MSTNSTHPQPQGTLPSKRYFGYRHVNGSIHVKRYRSIFVYGEAYDSALVQDITDVFPAPNYKRALEIAKRRLA